MSHEAKVSVILCAYTMARWPDICEAINSLRQQKLRPDEIVLVIDHNDNLLARATKEDWSDVVVVANRYGQGLSGARNTGIVTARHDLLAFLDDDAVAAPDWLAEYVYHAAESGVLGCTGTITPHWIGTRPGWFPEEFLWTVGCSYRGQPIAAQPVRNVLGASMLIKRTVFTKSGGFSSRLGRSGGTLVSCEETEMCIRAGVACPNGCFLFVPSADVAHKVPSGRLTWNYFLRRCYAEGQSKAFLAMLVQQRGALNTERNYVLRTLTSGVWRGVADTLLRGDPAGVARSAAIVFGLATTMCGYGIAKLHRRATEPSPAILLGAAE